MPADLWKSNQHDCIVSAAETPKGASQSPDLSHRTKCCPRCETEKPETEFSARFVKGKRYLQSYCQECLSGYVRGWLQTPEGRGRHRKSLARSYARYPERVAARRVVSQAIARGHMTKGLCQFAGRDCLGPVQAHHEDYSKPLEVQWLCRRHHTQADRARRERAA